MSYAFQILQKFITFENALKILLPCLKILALNRIYKKFKSLRVHLYDVHAQGNLWYNYTYSFLMFLYTYSHFGRLRRPMLALWVMNLFETDISLYVNLHRAKVFGTDIFLYVKLHRAKVFGTDIFLYVNLYRAKVFGTDIFLCVNLYRANAFGTDIST